jgi:hypothetical protein
MVAAKWDKTMRTGIMAIGFLALAMGIWVAALEYVYHRQAETTATQTARPARVVPGVAN